MTSRQAAWDQARAQGYAALADTAGIKVERRSYGDDPLEEWRRHMPQKEAPAQRRTTDAEALRGRQWERYINDQIAAAVTAALAERDEHWHDVVGRVVSQLRKALRAEFQEHLGQLRADVEIAKAHASGTVIDLPAILPRDRSRA